MIANIQSQLERDEGRRLQPYKDTVGLWTIGIGHMLGKELPQAFEQGISDETCDALFAADLHHVWDLLDVYIPWWSSIDGSEGVRGNVLVNMGFNLGVPGLASFHDFLALMKARDWEGAAADLERTKWYHQVGDRSARLCRQIRTGVWQ